MNSNKYPGESGLQLNEALIFEQSVDGRKAYSLPADDAPDVDSRYLPDTDILRADLEGMPEVSELDVVRHYTRLSSWNYSVDHGLYPLGSCTMKYNPKLNEKIAAMTEFADLHPHSPLENIQGALKVMFDLEHYLSEITGLHATSLQPAAGAQGELAGMLIIRAFHRSNGHPNRRIVLIPDSAHGTNPASAVIAGLKTKTIKSGPDGCINLESIQPYLNDELAGIMMTNPNTLGLFEKNACDIACAIKQSGGLVYMDGANLNAIMGISRPGDLGVDVMHMNLHKTFSTPHGGGGPGSGPIAVTQELERFLPKPRIVKHGDQFILDTNLPESIGKLHGFWGNFGVMLKAYAYIRSLGPNGIRESAENAVLNANYLRVNLQEFLHLPYPEICMHECVFNDRNQSAAGITTMDIAKRLIDYGFHPPTVYFPLIVKNAIMIEPTETESKETLDQFCRSIASIANECKTNPEIVKNAPHLPRRKRLDETIAARNPILKWSPKFED